MKKITHLLVDLDGTLVNGDGLRPRLEFLYWTARSLRPYGNILKTLQACYRMKMAVETVLNDSTNHAKMTQAFAETLGISSDEANALVEYSIRLNFPKLQRYFSPVNGAREFIQWAKERYSLILATNPVWDPEIVELRLSWGGIDIHHFKSFTHARRMHACKPHLQYYRELIHQEKLHPQQCFLIGNDPKNDLPAYLVGIPVFLVQQDRPKKKAHCQRIPLSGARDLAWQGSFQGLRQLLEVRLA